MKTLQSIRQSSSMHWVGNGFPVRSVFDYNGLGRELSPFLLLDYAAPYPFPPGHERRGVGAHPHKGFETVTIAYQGEVAHRDSSGGGGTIGPGDVQWMTAGRGIIHEEFHSDAFTRRGGPFQMVQLWVNLPAKDKNAPAGYQTLPSKDIPVVTLPDGAGTLRVIAGEFSEHRGPARTFTPINLWDASLRAGGNVGLPFPEGHTAAFLVLNGELELAGGRRAGEGALAILSRKGAGFTARATADTRVLIMSGQPIDEPIVGHGPFVMNTAQEIEQAFEEYQNGAMGRIGAN